MGDDIQIVEYKEIKDKFSNEQIHDFINLSMHQFIGKPLKIRQDCYQIEEYYLKNKGNFWIAIDTQKHEIIGSIALENRENIGTVKRFYVNKIINA